VSRNSVAVCRAVSRTDCWLLLVVAVAAVGLCDATMRQVLKLCRDAIITRDQVLSGAEESRGRYEPPANTAVPLRVLGWRGSFQWGKLLGGAAGEGGPSCKRTVAKGWLKRREIDLESKEPFMMNEWERVDRGETCGEHRSGESLSRGASK
jgi:hypothetical protein